VDPFLEEEEDHHRQSETVRAFLAVGGRQVSSGQFRSEKVGTGHAAVVDLAGRRVGHLDRIAVEDGDEGPSVDQDVRLVEISYDVSRAVEGVHHRRQVATAPHQVTPGDARGLVLAGMGVVGAEERNSRVEVDGGHTEPDYFPTDSPHRLDGPGQVDVAVGDRSFGRVGQHQLQFPSLLEARTAPPLFGQVGLAGHAEDVGLAAGSEQFLLSGLGDGH